MFGKRLDIMADTPLHKMSKQKWYRLTLYIYVILVIIVGAFFYLLIRDCLNFTGGDAWLYIARDVAFLAIALTLVFIQLFRNLWIIMRRSL